MKKLFKLFIFIIVLVLVFVAAFFVGRTPDPQPTVWGVNFSQTFAAELGLPWQGVYTAVLDNLGARRIKLATYWDLLEISSGQFSFAYLDWQVREAEKRNAKLLMVVGMKTPRWPECHIPQWAASLEKSDREKELAAFLTAVVNRYKNSPALYAWQVENEPFFPFGDCPLADGAFLKKEINLVHTIDPAHLVVVSDTGELSLWLTAARYGDVVGATLYRNVWFKELHTFISYPFSPLYYSRRIALIRALFHKNVIDVELQAEPWSPNGSPLTDSKEESDRTMSLEQLRSTINFAKRAGFSENYFWGAEWWYFEKQHGRPEFWEEAKQVIGNKQ